MPSLSKTHRAVSHIQVGSLTGMLAYGSAEGDASSVVHDYPFGRLSSYLDGDGCDQCALVRVNCAIHNSLHDDECSDSAGTHVCSEWAAESLCPSNTIMESVADTRMRGGLVQPESQCAPSNGEVAYWDNGEWKCCGVLPAKWDDCNQHFTACESSVFGTEEDDESHEIKFRIWNIANVNGNEAAFSHSHLDVHQKARCEYDSNRCVDRS